MRISHWFDGSLLQGLSPLPCAGGLHVSIGEETSETFLSKLSLESK